AGLAPKFPRAPGWRRNRRWRAVASARKPPGGGSSPVDTELAFHGFELLLHVAYRGGPWLTQSFPCLQTTKPRFDLFRSQTRRAGRTQRLIHFPLRRHRQLHPFDFRLEATQLREGRTTRTETLGSTAVARLGHLSRQRSLARLDFSNALLHALEFALHVHGVGELVGTEPFGTRPFLGDAPP